ncbi:potassium voltage-gated channel protein egl-36-like [Mercenaria mercenaria]|uniref:potassium voltage-gated channel protein egl-36-like n=1 Tax=Mercenaria mercenaria TaxID=6596 RepID=UPI00234F7A89|nr:potassium voltage-gated channel protein egl-36-like [Mercenaria mercenaria]
MVVSIPNAWYWAIVTMTTVGYGDISPESGFGRVIASLCAVSGVLLLSITLPMFVNNFLTYYQYSCVNESIEKRKKEKQTEMSVKEMKDAENETKDNHEYISDLTDIDRPPSYETFSKSRETVRVNVKESSNMHCL